eukprot:COSAG06_NODE_9920_length_1789_cov_3.786391_2_plen_369_part_00
MAAATANAAGGGGPSSMEEFYFDLRGFTILEGCLGAEELARINAWIDERSAVLQHASPGDTIDAGGGRECWLQSYYGGGGGSAAIDDGKNIQHVFEAPGWGAQLLDHPAWMSRVDHYIGDGFTPFMHELFINLRGPGGYIGCHSGGPRFDGDGHVLPSRWGAAVWQDGDTSHDAHSSEGTHRGHHVQWGCPYISIIVALEDIGPGDGATVVVPSSHKSLVGHPFQQQMKTEGGATEGAEEMHLKAGDALFFQDSILHGAAARTNQGLRKTLCFRYLPGETSTNRFDCASYLTCQEGFTGWEGGLSGAAARVEGATHTSCLHTYPHVCIHALIGPQPTAIISFIHRERDGLTLNWTCAQTPRVRSAWRS